MKFLTRVCMGFVLSRAILGLPLQAQEYIIDDSSIIEDSLSSEEHDARKEIGKETRKAIKIKELNKLLYCATALIEYQFDGNKSALQGIRYLDQVSKRLKRKDYHYKDLTKGCKSILRAYKKGYVKKRITQGLMSDQTRDKYLFKIQGNFPYSRNLMPIAKKALNERMTCRTVFGFDVKVGAIAAISIGWNHYHCETPLGRRYHLTGPNAGIGIGIGATIEMSIAERTTFTSLLDSRGYKIMEDDAHAWAVIAGKGQTFNNQEEKSADVTLGLGVHTMQRGHFMIKIKRDPNFDESGLYKWLGVPKEAMY